MRQFSLKLKQLHKTISIRHDNVIDLIMKITGKIIFKTTFRCPQLTPSSGQNIIFNR